MPHDLPEHDGPQTGDRFSVLRVLAYLLLAAGVVWLVVASVQIAGINREAKSNHADAVNADLSGMTDTYVCSGAVSGVSPDQVAQACASSDASKRPFAEKDKSLRGEHHNWTVQRFIALGAVAVALFGLASISWAQRRPTQWDAKAAPPLPAVVSTDSAGKGLVAERLAALEEMRVGSALTDEEYARTRQQILGDM